MKLMTGKVVGTIAMLPSLSIDHGRLHHAADDSSLDSVLASLAHLPSLADEDEPAAVRLVASARLSRFSGIDDFAGATIRADLARLVEDLEAEYDRLTAI